MFDGFDTFNPAYVIHYVMGPWGLKPAQAGLLVSSGLVGFLIGSAGHGMIADRIGRRATLLGAIWIASIFTLATAIFADSFLSFCVLRLFTGLGLGVLLPLGTTYINELAPRKVANVFTVWGVGFGWAMGGTIAGLVGVFATPIWGWRSIYYLGSLSFLLLIPLHLHLPESVRFLALRGRHDEIRRLLAKIRPERAQIYAKARIADPIAVSAQGSLAVLLGPRYGRTTLAIWASAFLVLFCIFGLSGWIPTVMMQRGETFSASFAFGAVMQIGSFVGGLACGWISDRRGSARAALACW
jgi:AAHS family 4-hydroxybenzoate transporter-like MFS transporter